MTTLAPAIQLPRPIFITAQPVNWMNRILSNRWAYHIVFWIFLFVFNAAYIVFMGEDRNVSMLNLVFRIPFILACCYLNMYWLMPRFYYSGKLLIYGLLILCLLFLLNAISLFLLEVFIESPICPSTFEADATFTGSNYVYKAFYLFSLVGLTSGIKLSKNHLAEKQKADAIEKEKLQTELSFLKSQIHPHFFFNTLNNLYALTIRKSDLAPEMLLKLSDLMSYGLYEGECQTVRLENEIQHIKNYIELESLRLGTRMTVKFDVEGKPYGCVIPPLIFLPFIENCFKHAAFGTGQGIIIRFIVHDKAITLQTSNPYSLHSKSLNRKGGLGLKNAQRRLQLLYENSWSFQSSSENNVYSTTVQIPLL